MAGVFGTDGVRARINTGPMRAESVVQVWRWQQVAGLRTKPLMTDA